MLRNFLLQPTGSWMPNLLDNRDWRQLGRRCFAVHLASRHLSTTAVVFWRSRMRHRAPKNPFICTSSRQELSRVSTNRDAILASWNYSFTAAAYFLVLSGASDLQV